VCSCEAKNNENLVTKNNNIMKKLLLLLVTMMLPIMASAYEKVPIGSLYYNLNEETKEAEVTSGNRSYSFSEISIPEKVIYNGTEYFVTNICTGAFYNCTNLYSVTIPNSVISIGADGRSVQGAFWGCTSLTSIVIPNSVKSIGMYTFYNCNNLVSITIPSSVKHIGYGAFTGTAWYDNQPEGLIYAGKVVYKYKGTMPDGKDIIIEDGTEALSAGAFINCSGLKSITIPNSVKNIDSERDYYFGGVKGAFTACSNLISVSLPNNLTTIESGTFLDCISLTTITIPNSVTSIGSSAFENCTSLASISIPNSVTSIGSSAFSNCDNLVSFIIPNKVTCIESGTFKNCSSLVSVTIPNSVTKIEGYEYSDPNSYSEYGAFSGCSSLTSISIPNSITEIGVCAFRGCSSLNTITIPNSVTSIGNSVFKDCSGLSTAILPSSLTSISNETFRNCYNLSSVTIPNNVLSIGEYAFYNCYNLTSIEIPCDIRIVGAYAFAACKNITSVTIPNSLTTFGESAFAGCSSLTSVIISNGVKTIGERAFSGCTSLTSVTIPNSVTSIGEGAFEYCYEMETLKLPEELQIIKKATFRWCSKLKSLTIPSTVEYIYSEAFSKCNALESIKALPENPPFLYDNSFSNYSVPLMVPKGCKEAYQTAQGWKNFTNISDSKYKLTYLVDGEEYKSYDIEYGEAITPEAEPTKETYKFSGWSEIPETMPAHDVVVTGTFTRYFDVGNLTKAVDFVMNGSASAEETALYDLNNNEKMDVGDVILIVKFILNNIYNAPSYIGRRAGEVTDLSQFTAAQFEVKTAGNVDIRLVKSMEQTHQLMCQQKDANTYAVVVYSLSNQLMQPENGKIIETDNNSEILSIENVTVATPTGETVYYQTLSATTGIEQIESENGNGTAVIYDLKGNRLNNSKALNKGIYIVNGKKAVVR